MLSKTLLPSFWSHKLFIMFIFLKISHLLKKPHYLFHFTIFSHSCFISLWMLVFSCNRKYIYYSHLLLKEEFWMLSRSDWEEDKYIKKRKKRDNFKVKCCFRLNGFFMLYISGIMFQVFFIINFNIDLLLEYLYF